MAASPPRRSTSAAVASSSSVTQSQSRLPAPNGTSSARWPIANDGVVPIPTSSPCSRIAFACVDASSASVVHCWPVAAGTYWRQSVQIGQDGGGLSAAGNCVPHALQMNLSIPVTLRGEWGDATAEPGHAAERADRRRGARARLRQPRLPARRRRADPPSPRREAVDRVPAALPRLAPLAAAAAGTVHGAVL